MAQSVFITTMWTVEEPATPETEQVNRAEAQCPFCGSHAYLLETESSIPDSNGCEHFARRYNPTTGKLEFVG